MRGFPGETPAMSRSGHARVTAGNTGSGRERPVRAWERAWERAWDGAWVRAWAQMATSPSGLAGWGVMDRPSGLAVTTERPPGATDATPLVVLVHGSLDRSTSFARVMRRLTDLVVVTYDRRGYHRSREALPLNTTLDGHVDDLLSVIDGRPAVVIGHSYGGDVALAAAERCGPDGAVTSVAAFEPPVPWLDLWATRGASSSPPGLGDDPALAAERFFRRIVGDDGWEHLPERAKQERRADGAALVTELAAIRRGPPPFDVSALGVPVLYGRGERSLPHQRGGATWLAEHTPGAEIVEIAGATHGAHLTHPDAFAALVRRAVDRALASTRTDKTCASS